MSTIIPAVEHFVSTLYATSDVGQSGHQAYVDLYLPDATLIMGLAMYSGHDGVQTFREAGWEKVLWRRHVCRGIFPSPSSPSTEIMTYGTVDYGFKDGTVKEGVEWAARLVLAYVEGQPKLAFYQVYIVSKNTPFHKAVSLIHSRPKNDPERCLVSFHWSIQCPVRRSSHNFMSMHPRRDNGWTHLQPNGDTSPYMLRIRSQTDLVQNDESSVPTVRQYLYKAHFAIRQGQVYFSAWPQVWAYGYGVGPTARRPGL